VSIHDKIPSGRDVRQKSHEFVEKVPLENIRCHAINLQRAKLSIGTLGGGNHFIEADSDETEIQSRIKDIKEQVRVDIPKDLAYVTGDLFDDYINDMKITQLFAVMNRKAMMKVILEGLEIADDGRHCPQHSSDRRDFENNKTDL